ncbi:hypothetical protein BGZ83_010058 [Gryganskiella cystojenkinii]|nr:hypothetical protein BGZ83_010058 [Gryganskiella cystojenkinii]
MASDDDDNFPFAFGATSDNEDEGNDDGLFCAPKTVNPTTNNTKTTSSSSSRNATLAILKDQEPYVAQIDQDGWFQRLGKPIRELMLQDKNGATKVKMQADYNYMLHRYQQAFEIAQEYCQIVAENEASVKLASGSSNSNQNNVSSGGGGMQRSDSIVTDGTEGGSILKVTDSKEMQEMMVRCLLKLNRPEAAVTIAEGLTSQETSIIFLKAKVFTAVGRHRDAAITLFDYQKARASNYAVWRALGECFHEASLRPVRSQTTTTATAALEGFSSMSLSSSEAPVNLSSLLALICVLRARHLMRVSIWSQVSYAQARYDREMQIIENQTSEYERACGLPSLMEDDALRIQEYESKIVNPSRLALRVLENTKGSNQICDDDDGFPLDVVKMVISSWDPQLIESSATGVPAEDEDQTAEPSVRNK